MFVYNIIIEYIIINICNILCVVAMDAQHYFWIIMSQNDLYPLYDINIIVYWQSLFVRYQIVMFAFKFIYNSNNYNCEWKKTICLIHEHLGSVLVFWWVLVIHRFSFLCCPIMCLSSFSSVLWCPLRFPHKNDVWFVFICL